MKKYLIIGILGIVVFITIAVGFYKWNEIKKQFIPEQTKQILPQEKDQQLESDTAEKYKKREIELKKELEFDKVVLPAISINKNDIFVSAGEEIKGGSYKNSYENVSRVSYMTVGTIDGPKYIEYSSNANIRVYPLEEYKKYVTDAPIDDSNSELILKTLKDFNDGLKQKREPDKVIQNMFPLPNAACGSIAYPKYLDFKNGSGVRSIMQCSQSYEPPHSFFYYFQGITKDNKYLVNLTVDLFSPKLKNFYEKNKEPEPSYTADVNNPQRKAYDKYIKDAYDILKTEKESDYSPNLLEIDNAIKSLQLNY